MTAFQPQNPALSGDPYGWVDCQAFSAAMAISFAKGVAKAATGTYVRSHSNEDPPDPASPGLDLGQVAAVASALGVHIDVQRFYPWDEFAGRINSGEGAILDGRYSAIHGTHFDAGQGFTGNHAVFVPPGWAAMDPLASGLGGIYQYHGEVYPQTLLRAFAGALQVVAGSSLGAGLVYAGFVSPPISGGPVVIVSPSEVALNVTKELPGLIADVGAATLYNDPDRHSIRWRNWGGAKNVGVYARANPRVLPDGRAGLSAIRVSGTGGVNPTIAYVGDNELTNLRLVK